MRAQMNFQVFWRDLTYTIDPKDILGPIRGVQSRLTVILSNFYRLLSNSRFIQVSNSENAAGSTKILQDICGSFESGQLTAVIGPSGAGKTSLLNFISRRREAGYSGHLYVKNSLRKIYVTSIPQDHTPTEYLTVRENLLFASRMKNPTPGYDHESRVNEYSQVLGLDDCFDTITRDISGGQQKRLSIAQELMSKPDILILDEPTSGLDSVSCFKTLRALKDLVEASKRGTIEPIAILLTIHQPEEEVFDLFDKVYGLACGGRVIYDGPPEDCGKFIQKHTGLKLQSEDSDSASFLIEVASGEFGQEPIDALESRVKLEFKCNIETSVSEPVLDSCSVNVDCKSDADRTCRTDSSDGSRRKSSEKFRIIDQNLDRFSSNDRGYIWQKTWVLSTRYWLSMTRKWIQTFATIMFYVIFPLSFAILVGSKNGSANACPKYSANLTLREILDDGEMGVVQDEFLRTVENMGVLVDFSYTLLVTSSAITTLTFALDCERCMRESYNGWYSMSSYLLARTIIDLPFDMVLPFIAVSLGFPLTGQVSNHGMSNTRRFFMAASAVSLCSLVTQSFGMIIAALYVGRVTLALFLSQAMQLPILFLSGFVLRLQDLPWFLGAVSDLSIFKHLLTIIFSARYGFNSCECDPKQFIGVKPRILDVSEDLRNFTKHWVNSFIKEDTEGNSTQDDEPKDMFELFAEQAASYQRYGMKLESCQDVVPFQMHDLKVDDKNVPINFLVIIATLLIVKLLLFLAVRHTFRRKASL